MSVLSAALVHGAPRRGTVVASTRLGCYVLLDDESAVLPVLTCDALALPTAVRLGEPAEGAPLRLAPGQGVLVGDSRIAAPGLTVGIVRTVRPAQVRRTPAALPHTPLRRDHLLERLGRGPGLTPEGDDEIAGHLLVVAAAGGIVPDLEPDLHRTTALSASLLRAAAQGYAVPEVVAYVDAVIGEDALTERRLRPRVAAIGHTSGPALLRGIHSAFDGVAEPSTERTVA
ncbi:MAG: DUF2877 domain-containing protein [Intrasporangiaceae bacterium]|nr:DUF2877 domain-containing protein [Intrasporangiaceae bacterium]